VIELSGVAKTYPGFPAVEALQPCDLTVDIGDYVTVVGPSGSGKSTLLNSIGLLDRPSAGEYKLDGIDVRDLNEKERTWIRGSKIGFVFQSFQLLDHRTSLENVMLSTLYRGLPTLERRRRALDALEAVGLPGRVDSHPARMSGGERQRVAIARALAGDPSILLCDEPTGNLDSANSEAILDLFDALSVGGISIVMITHDLKIAQRGNRQVSIRDGVLSEPTLIGADLS
jgi:putative ABC transport system ATP-binding protein